MDFLPVEGYNTLQGGKIKTGECCVTILKDQFETEYSNGVCACALLSDQIVLNGFELQNFFMYVRVSMNFCSS